MHFEAFLDGFWKGLGLILDVVGIRRGLHGATETQREPQGKTESHREPQRATESHREPHKAF